MDRQKFLDVCEKLKKIEIETVSESSKMDLYSVAAFFRMLVEDKGRLIATAWKEIEPNRKFKVEAYALSPKTVAILKSNFGSIILGGASDQTTKLPEIENPSQEQLVDYSSAASSQGFPVPLVIGTTTENKDILMPPSSSYGYICSVSGLEDDEVSVFSKILDEEASRKVSMSLDDFLNKYPVVVMDGEIISRADILKYLFNTKNAIHDYCKDKSSEWKKKRSVLLKLDESKTLVRPYCDYIYMSVLRDLVESPDAKVLMSHAK